LKLPVILPVPLRVGNGILIQRFYVTLVMNYQTKGIHDGTAVNYRSLHSCSERSDFQKGAAESGCGLYFWRGRALSFAHSCANEKDGLFALGRDA